MILSVHRESMKMLQEGNIDPVAARILQEIPPEKNRLSCRSCPIFTDHGIDSLPQENSGTGYYQQKSDQAFTALIR